jgi:crotonobetainyl-CoA:carnitine CoA-transferase CaiB-like acyl-CoA transferase
VDRNGPGDMSVSMMVRGRNKESITLNLKHPESREVFLDLARQADIIVENYSAGVTGRLGIDYTAVKEVNPRLVYTSISGFGAQGVAGDGKAMDTIIQALSGVMMTAGEPGDPPVRFGLPVGDLVAPLFAVIGTLSAIIHAEATGEGQHVDVSMLGSLTSLVACEPFDALESVGIPLRTGAVVPRLAPFGTFEAADGWFAICAPTDAFAEGALRAIGLPHLVADDRFARRDARVRNADELHGYIRAWASTRPLNEVIGSFEQFGVPVAPVRDTAEAIRDQLVLDRHEVVPLVHPQFGQIDGLYGSGLPVNFSRSRVDLSRPAPDLGQQTATVLSEMLGFDQEHVDRLRADGVL